MKANEFTQSDFERWKKDGWIPCACRLCGEITLFPKKTYKQEQLVGYECANCKSVIKEARAGDGND